MEPLVVKMSTARPNDSVSGSAQKLPKALAIGKPTKVKRAEKVVKSSLAGQQSAGRCQQTIKKLRNHRWRAASLTGESRSCLLQTSVTPKATPAAIQRNSTWSHEEKGRNPTQDAYVLRGALLDCPLKYKKGESQTNEIVGDQDFSKLLQEEHVAKVCADMVALLPEDVFTEMGVSDLAQQFLLNVGTAIRQLRKTGNNRLARAYGNHRQPNGETH
ncbi:hypothetical protein pipiens_015394 [Culex pipiens pipiens]|uniref:Uncharacterized protein n=1 Tax=Culex pipiens pipiens TaxID=38569 RepID=A0ABD1CQQ5_CULPP